MKYYIPTFICLVSIFLLSFVDAIFTAHYSTMEGFKELNPVMEYFLEWGVGWFIAVKVLIVSTGCVVLWKYRHYTTAQLGTGFIFAVYSLILAWHLVLRETLNNVC